LLPEAYHSFSLFALHAANVTHRMPAQLHLWATKKCSWRLLSPFRLGRPRPLPSRTGTSLSVCTDGDEVRHRERRAPVGSRTRTHPYQAVLRAVEREHWWRCSVTLRVSLLARQARSLLHIPLAPSQRIERCSPDLETGCPPWAARHRAPRMGCDPISTRLDKPPSTPADSRGLG